MQLLQRGQKLKWDALSPGPRLQIGVSAELAGASIDYSCFGVDAAGKLSDERYFVFYNQKATPCGGVCLSGAAAGDAQRFAVDLEKLPASICRLVFVLTIDGAGEMGQIQGGHWRVYDGDGGALVEFPLNRADFGAEKAVIAGEFYRKEGWRLSPVGQGFNGGLAVLLRHFGGEEAPAESAPAPSAPPAPAPSKLVLTKKTDVHKISLQKSAAQTPIVVTAKWVDNGDGADDNDDLDLKAGLLLPDGRMRIVHAENLGALEREPYVRHLGDVLQASSAAPGQETIHVNPKIAELLGGPVAIVFSVYSAVGNGAVSVAELHPVMRLQHGEQIIECALDFTKDPKAHQSNVYTYVIGIVTIRGSEVEITPSGAVSEPDSEATAWLAWEKDGLAAVTLNGPVVMKGKANKAAEEMNKGNPRRYVS